MSAGYAVVLGGHWNYAAYSGSRSAAWTDAPSVSNGNIGGRGAFIPPQPYPSWTLNPDTALWDAPTPMPTEGGAWTWDEDTLAWVALT